MSTNLDDVTAPVKFCRQDIRRDAEQWANLRWAQWILFLLDELEKTEKQREAFMAALREIDRQCDYQPAADWNAPLPWQRIAREALCESDE